MNNTIRRAMLLLLAAPTLAFAAKKPVEPSLISTYAGNYSGTVLVTAPGSTVLFGTTQGSISASKKKENGSISLTSFVNQMGTTLIIGEFYSIRKRSLSYLLTVSPGTTAPGSGSVKVGKKQITYTAFVNVGGDSAFLTGKMTLNKKKLTINETLATSTGSLVFTYSLTKRGGGKK